jgi:ADP-heptose:LPS heptosyltransferase
MKYLVQNRVGLAILLTIDWLVCLFPKRKRLVERPKKILLSSLAHLGDVVIGTSILPLLKKVYPEAEIGFLAGSWAEPILRGHPLVDHLHFFDHWKISRTRSSLFAKWRRHQKMKKKVIEEIRSYDWAIDLSPFFPNGIFLFWKAGIGKRSGFTSGGFGPLLTHPYVWKEEEKSMADRLVPLIEREETGLRPWLKEPRKRGGDYLVLHLGAGQKEKLWPLSHWKRLVSLLQKEPYELLFTGYGEEEKEMVSWVLEGEMRGENLVGKLNFEEFTGVIGGARALIGVDSVAGHVASAFGVRSILLYTGINPISLWKPQGATALFASVPCFPCGKKRGCEAMSCIRDVSAEEVVAFLNREAGRFSSASR